jgi:hypothetical protein
MPTLIVASPPFQSLVGGRRPWCAVFDESLTRVALETGWSVVAYDGVTPPAAPVGGPAVYVTTELALAAARALDLVLLEPPLDLLARVPARFLRRVVEPATFAGLDRLRGPTFVKPADPLDKWFDAGVYSDARGVRTRGRVSPDAPVLLSEPVEWAAELRYFVLEGKVVAGSPYLSFGRPNWRVWEENRPSAIPPSGLPLVERLCDAMRGELPPAFVVDVGVIEGCGWAVVEFNPAWCAGLLGADPRAVLPVLLRATRPRNGLAGDARWVVPRE